MSNPTVVKSLGSALSVDLVSQKRSLLKCICGVTLERDHISKLKYLNWGEFSYL